MTVEESLKGLTLQKEQKDSVNGFFETEVREYIEYIKELDKTAKSNLSNKQKDDLSVELNKRSNDLVLLGEKIVSDIGTKKAAKTIKNYFRSILKEWYSQGKIMWRGWEKPKGYPGDYELLEYIYDNKPISEGLGALYDISFHLNALAIGVRNRKNATKEFLKKYIADTKTDEISLLNLACGSSRELRELFKEKEFSGKKLIFDLVDFDADALRFSEDSLKSVPKGRAEINFLQKDILKLIRSKENDFNKHYNIVYSIGLSDYMPDKMLKNFVRYQYDLLLKGGKLIISHKNVDVYDPIIIDWFCDWSFYSRNKEYLDRLIKESLEGEKYSREDADEPSKAIFFVNLTKE